MTECEHSKSDKKVKQTGEVSKSRRRKRRGNRSNRQFNEQSKSNNKQHSKNSQGSNSKTNNQRSRRDHSNSKNRRNRSFDRNRSKRSSKNLTTRLSENFSKEDFWVVDDDGKQRLKISLGLVGALESLQSKLDKKITIVQGYITPEQAEKAGNWKRNFHPLGLAADIKVSGLSLEELFLVSETIETFKGIGLDIVNDHVHVDVRNVDERVLWVVKKGEEVELTDDLRAMVFNGVKLPELKENRSETGNEDASFDESLKQDSD